MARPSKKKATKKKAVRKTAADYAKKPRWMGQHTWDMAQEKKQRASAKKIQKTAARKASMEHAESLVRGFKSELPGFLEHGKKASTKTAKSRVAPKPHGKRASTATAKSRIAPRGGQFVDPGSAGTPPKPAKKPAKKPVTQAQTSAAIRAKGRLPKTATELRRWVNELSAKPKKPATRRKYGERPKYERTPGPKPKKPAAKKPVAKAKTIGKPSPSPFKKKQSRVQVAKNRRTPGKTAPPAGSEKAMMTQLHRIVSALTEQADKKRTRAEALGTRSTASRRRRSKKKR
jgi:hypothetical protein